MSQTKIELNLVFDEYRALTDALTGAAYSHIEVATHKIGNIKEHLEIADALANARHQIASKVGLEGEELDPVSKAVLKAWQAYNSPVSQENCCPRCGYSLIDF